jgi:hypothetical protein
VATFYADENFRRPVVEALRRLGHDVLTSEEAGRAGQGIPDEEVLADAMAFGRILLSQNRGDFIALDRQGLPHCGIVACTYDPDSEGHALRISEAVTAQEPGGRWLVPVYKPNLGARKKKP